jgi:hypothetical protein
MSELTDSLAAFAELLRKKNPAYLDLATAQTDDESEKAFIVILESAIQHLEKNKRNFAPLGEVGLSAVMAGALSMPGLLAAIPEANSNGHVDLMIEIYNCEPPRLKLGEAKIYAGPSYHIKGVGQLLGRYTTGRELPGLLISYVRKENIKTSRQT